MGAIYFHNRYDKYFEKYLIRKDLSLALAKLMNNISELDIMLFSELDFGLLSKNTTLHWCTIAIEADLDSKQMVLNIFNDSTFSVYARLFAFWLLREYESFSASENTIVNIEGGYTLLKESIDIYLLEELALFVFEESDFIDEIITKGVIRCLIKEQSDKIVFNTKKHCDWVFNTLMNTKSDKIHSFFRYFCKWIHEQNLLSNPSLYGLIQRICLICVKSVSYDQIGRAHV